MLIILYKLIVDVEGYRCTRVRGGKLGVFATCSGRLSRTRSCLPVASSPGSNAGAGGKRAC